MEEYCLVVVGNKTDLAPNSEDGTVSEDAALHFIDELVPHSESPTSSLATPEDEGDWMSRHVPAPVLYEPDDEAVVRDNGNIDSGAAGPENIILVDETRVLHPATPNANNDVGADWENSTPTFLIPPPTPSIAVHTHHHYHSSKSRPRTSQFNLMPNGTMSSTHSGLTSFHTPASSFSDGYGPYESALSSPLSHSRSPSSSPPLYNHRSYRTLSMSAMSTSTAPTITPARYATAHALAQTTLPRPPRGPKLFFTSAKTGAGVSDVFAYVARRVVMRWEWEEAHAGTSNLVENCSTVHLGNAINGKRSFRPACCPS